MTLDVVFDATSSRSVMPTYLRRLRLSVGGERRATILRGETLRVALPDRPMPVDLRFRGARLPCARFTTTPNDHAVRCTVRIEPEVERRVVQRYFGTGIPVALLLGAHYAQGSLLHGGAFPGGEHLYGFALAAAGLHATFGVDIVASLLRRNGALGVEFTHFRRRDASP